MSRTIDAHHHYWRTAAQAQPWRTAAHLRLAQDFGPDELVQELDAAGVDATVLMQSVDEAAENDRLAEYATHERVAGVVSWLPIRLGSAALAELSRVEIPKRCGIRCLIADDPLEWLSHRQTIKLFREIAGRQLAWDVVPITSAQTRAVLGLAQSVPDLRIVIDHLGRPPIETAAWEPWASHLHELAGNPNVAVKVSVGIDALTAWQDWDGAALERYVAYACELFGSRRLMLASNWPVVLLRAPYARAWADLAALVVKHLPDAEARTDVLGGTAERWYRLEADPHAPARKEALTQTNR